MHIDPDISVSELTASVVWLAVAADCARVPEHARSMFARRYIGLDIGEVRIAICIICTMKVNVRIRIYERREQSNDSRTQQFLPLVVYTLAYRAPDAAALLRGRLNADVACISAGGDGAGYAPCAVVSAPLPLSASSSPPPSSPSPS